MGEGLERLVGAARRRLMRQRVIDRLASALRPALALAVILLGADKLWRLRFEPWYPILAGLGLATLVGLAWGWPRRLTLHRAALILDDRLQASERVSSALALRASGYDGPLLQPVMEDAEAHLQGVDLRAALPGRWPGGAKMSVALLLLLALLQFTPRLSLWRSETDLATELVTRQVGEELQAKAEDVQAQAKDKGADEARRAADQLLRQALKLRRGRMSKEEALRNLESMKAELQQQREKLAGEPLERTAKQARRDLRRMGDLSEQMADQLDDPRLDAAQRLLEELAQKAEDGKLSPKEAKEAAEQLKRAAEALQKTPYGKQAQKLSEAAKALSDCAESGNSEGACAKAGQALSDAAKGLSEDGGMTPNQELLDDLQDYLENGKNAVGDSESIKREADQQGGKCPGGLCEGNQPSNSSGRAGLNRGPGSTNRESSPTPADGSQQDPYEEGQSPPDTGPRSEYEKLYAPRRTETLQHDERAMASPSSSGRYSAVEGPRGAPSLDDSKVPYYEVLGEYQAAADDAITKGSIPLTERARVKSYFEELQEPAGN